MKYIVRKSVVYVLGNLWMPGIVASQSLTLSAYDVENARDGTGKLTRDSIENWLSTHSGDFSRVIDFSASIEDGGSTLDIPWSSEENELAYYDTQGVDD